MAPDRLSCIGPGIASCKIDADGIPIKALLSKIGQHFHSVLGMKKMEGIPAQKNTMSFIPEQIAHLRGQLRSVATSANGLTLTYGPLARPVLPSRAGVK